MNMPKRALRNQSMRWSWVFIDSRNQAASGLSVDGAANLSGCAALGAGCCADAAAASAARATETPAAANPTAAATAAAAVVATTVRGALIIEEVSAEASASGE